MARPPRALLLSPASLAALLVLGLEASAGPAARRGGDARQLMPSDGRPVPPGGCQRGRPPGSLQLWSLLAVAGPGPETSKVEVDDVRLASGATFLALCVSLFLVVQFRPDWSVGAACEGGGEVGEGMCTSGDNCEGALDEGGGRQTVGLFHLLAITSLNLAYGFMVTSFGLLVGPLEAERLFPGQAATGLMMFGVIGGVAQVAAPIAGVCSDKYPSRWGRRRPLLILFIGLICTCSFGCWALSRMRLRIAFFFVFFIMQLGWAAAYAVQGGLLPDVLSSTQSAMGGGAIAANALAGAFSALIWSHFLGGHDYHLHYAMIASLALLCCFIVCISANEASSLAQSQFVGGNVDWMHKMVDCFYFDAWKHPEFAKLLFMKTAYCAAVMVKTYLLFFTKDVLKLDDRESVRTFVSDIAIAGELFAVLAAGATMLFLGSAVGSRSTSPRSSLQDRTAADEEDLVANGSSGKRAAIVGAAWMAVLWIGPIIVACRIREERDFWISAMIPLTAIWGLGHGTYCAGEQALTYALLPDNREASRFIGIVCITSSVGASSGAALNAILIYVFGGGGNVLQDDAPDDAPGYGLRGYVAVFAGGGVALSCCLAALPLWIRVVPRGAAACEASGGVREEGSG